MRSTLNQPVGTAAQTPNKRHILLFYIYFMVMPAGYPATSARRTLLIGYRVFSSFPRVWTASAPMPGSIIGSYRRLVERHSRLFSREYRAFFNRSPVTA
jgi:hypothetical protein